MDNNQLSAADAVSGAVEYGQLRALDCGLFWVEYRPDAGGRNLLCRRSWQGEKQTLTPEGFSVHSRVCEYGGHSWCHTAQGVAFVNGSDQQVWVHSLDRLSIHQLTFASDCRFGDLVFDHSRNRIIAVCQQERTDPTQPELTLVAIDGESGAIFTLASGEDFYSNPVLDQNTDQIAWISWNHPQQPWTASRLNLATFTGDGLLKQIVSSQEKYSIQQPRFTKGGDLLALSDRSGWWNLYRYLDIGGELSEGLRSSTNHHGEGLWPLDRDFGIAQWQSGVYTWDSLDSGQTIVASYLEQGQGKLVVRSNSGMEQPLAEEFSLFRHLCSYGERIYCIAHSASRAAAVLEITKDQGSWQVSLLHGGQQPAYPSSKPEPFSYPVDDEEAHGFFYQPPSNKPEPPVIVFSHGGPTAATYPVLNPMIQFWTQKGFAVADLNYRGSTGYGRLYRQKLKSNWGVTDWQDAEAALDYLASHSRVDASKAFIRGSSAGGYTTLNALVFSDRFCAGASYYGVSDPSRLALATHKFESHYLDWLIGDPADTELYSARSPLQHADRIHCPVIFFQGEGDRVVVPEQTEAMAKVLKQQGNPVELHYYADEKHGFRLPQNRIHSLEAELSFYKRFLD